MSANYDDRESAWAIRDRDVANVAKRLESAADLEEIHSVSTHALGYLTLAAQAGQAARLKTWALLLGAARDAAFDRVLLGGVR